jgi:hypothetical protein
MLALNSRAIALRETSFSGECSDRWRNFFVLFKFLLQETMEVVMGRGILLWLLGVPIPIIILLALFWH